jgi:galactose mutarotase-like enzyme
VSDPQSAWISLSSGDLSAQVNPLGAQLSTLRDRAGRDLLWDGDPSVWNGRAPLLFPIVGALAGGSYRLNAATHSLPRHGFARGRLFEIVEWSSAAAALTLTADEATLQIYPFHFRLDIRFALEGSTLSVITQVRNEGSEDMPASFGYHPAFRWPLPFGRTRSSHGIGFEQDEPAPIRRLNADGLMKAERFPTPIVHRRLALDDALFQDDVIIFDRIRSRSVIYGAADGPALRVDYPDSPYLGLWTKPGAGFICVEPWHGVADPEGFSGEFSTKPGVFVLAPGASLPITMAITLLEV